MQYCIFPPIGVARLGNSDSYFVGPEVVGSLGRELGGAAETEVANFKDAQFRVKKQAARFHLYQRATSAEPFTPAVLPPGTSVRWRVRVANKKDAIQRPNNPPGAVVPPAQLRPTADPARADRLIDSGNAFVQGSNVAGVVLQGTHRRASNPCPTEKRAATTTWHGLNARPIVTRFDPGWSGTTWINESARTASATTRNESAYAAFRS